MSDYGLPTPCNCCAPSCPVPIIESQSKQMAAGQCGFFGAPGGQYYEKFTTEYEKEVPDPPPDIFIPEEESRSSTRAFRPDGTCETTTTDTAGYQLGAACDSFVEGEVNGLVTTYQGFRLNGDVINFTETFSGAAKTNSDLLAVVDAYIDTWPTEPGIGGSVFFQADYTQSDGEDTEFYKSVYIGKSRIRYRIPEGPNTYLRVVIEETFTPADYDLENPEISPKVVTESELTASGPEGVTSWKLIECPSPGSTQVTSLKYSCYTGGPLIG